MLMALHPPAFLWFFSGFRGNWTFIIGFIVVMLVLRFALRSFFPGDGMRRGGGPRYSKYNQPQPPKTDQGQSTEKPYYGAPGTNSEGQVTGAETVRTGGVDTRRVDNWSSETPSTYGEPTRPLNGKPETPIEDTDQASS
jgi:hypothetical protein